MTKEQKLKKLKEAIISAVPEIKKQMDIRGEVFVERDITLEDVLITIKRKEKEINKSLASHIPKYPLLRIIIMVLADLEQDFWQFNKPLDQQSSDTIDFLYNILCQ